jgi:hypothetical protein
MVLSALFTFYGFPKKASEDVSCCYCMGGKHILTGAVLRCRRACILAGVTLLVESEKIEIGSAPVSPRNSEVEGRNGNC